MARGDQLYRQWAILVTLTRGARSRRDLARDLGVSRKTITRDIDALSALFPIAEDRDGIDVIYTCASPHRLPHVAWTPRESAAARLGRESVLKALSHAPFRGALASALDKADAQQQQRLNGGDARDLSEAYRADFNAPSAREEHQRTLLEAALKRRRVRMRYFTAVRQARSTRVVEPFLLHLHPYGLHLVAHCLTRGEVISFNVNLIEAVEVLDQTFDPATRGFDRDAYLASGFDGYYQGPLMAVHVVIHPPSSYWVRDRFFHVTERFHTRPDGAVELRFEARGDDAIAKRVLGLGPDCEVVAPEALRDLVRQYAQAIVARCDVPG